MSPGRRLAMAFLLGVVAAGSLLPYLDHPYIRDDVSMVQANPSLSRGLSPWPFLTEPDTYSIVPEFNRRHYRPLATWSLAVDVALSGRSPGSFRRTNAWLHGLATALLVFLIPALLRALAPGTAPRHRDRAGLLVALLFALHPISVLAVGYAANRALALLAVLGAATLLSYLDARARPSAGRTLRTLLLFALALGCKENAVMLVAVVALLEWTAPTTEDRAAAGRRVVGLALVVVAYLGLAASIGVGGSTLRQLSSLEEHLLHWRTQLGVVLEVYLPALLWPPTVRWEPAFSVPGVGAAAGLLGLALGTLGVALRLRRRAPVEVFSVVAGFLPMVPTFVVVQPVAAEIYRLYPGLPFLVLAVLWPLRRVWGRGAGLAAVLLVAALLAYQGAELGRAGARPETLWSHGRRFGLSRRGRHALATATRDPRRQLEELGPLLEEHPDFPRARVSRARALLLTGQVEAAWSDLERVAEPLAEDPVRAFLVAVVRRLRGEPPTAGEAPEFPPAYAAGYAYQALQEGRRELAEAVRRVARLDGAEGWFPLYVAGRVAAAGGDVAEAAALYRRSLEAGGPAEVGLALEELAGGGSGAEEGAEEGASSRGGIRSSR